MVKLLRKPKKKRQPNLAAQKTAASKLIAAARNGDKSAEQKLTKLLKDRKMARFIKGVIEVQKTNHLRGYKGVDHGNPLNYKMWPYRK